MVIVMEKHTSETNIERVMAELITRGFDVHRSTGSDQTVLGVVGNVATIDPREFELFDGVQEVVRISEPYKLSSRTFRAAGSISSVSKRSGGSCSGAGSSRRSMASTRATSSAGENGLTT